MKAIILPVGNTDAMSPLTTWMPEFLIPVVNKPIVEHLIELLVRHNIRDIILVLKHMPYETEQYFGAGERWGANISYSLEKEYKGIGPSLGRISSRLDELFLCLPCNIITNVDISDLVRAHEKGYSNITVSKKTKKNNSLVDLRSDKIKKTEGFYPFIMTPKALSGLLTSPGATKCLNDIISSLTAQGLSLNAYYSSYALRTIHSLDDYLKVNRLVLKDEFSGIVIPGRQSQADIWVGRQTKIHPDVKIVSPSLIGSRCNIHSGTIIGGGTIIGDNVIVDREVLIEGSVILGNTYVGSHTEIRDSVIRKNAMIDVPRLLNVYVGDNFILGDLDRKVLTEKGARLFNLTLALFLLLLFSPIMIMLCLYHLIFPSKRYFASEERLGRYEVVDLEGNMKPRPFRLYTFRSKNRFIQKLPGLFNVIKGDMNLVGNSPLTEEEVACLKGEWEKLRFNAPSGLFYLWQVEDSIEPTWEEKMVTENYYASTRSFWGDVKILLKSFFPARKI